ncbi:MAG: hypothetical protein CMC88_00265 [Flavobacteriaceae bacterium]|nr:hypothetical protein [Flavobacteriaceae bacterium]
MENEALFNEWLIGLVLVSAIVVIAAILLILVFLAARRILRLAVAALKIVTQIKNNTNAIWELENTNKVALNIKNEAEAIEEHATLVADALK